MYNYYLSDSQAVSVDQIIGKDLFAKRPVVAMNQPSDTGAVLKNIAKGERVGTVYSWVYGKDAFGNNTSDIWWMLDKDTLKPYYTYVKHDPASFDWKNLTQQGAETEVQQAQDKKEASMTFLDKVEAELTKDGKKILIGLGIVAGTYAGIKLYKEYKK